MMKKNTIFGLVLLLSIIMLTGCVKQEVKKEQISDALKFKEEYEALNGKTSTNKKKYPRVDIPSENAIKYATEDEILDVLESKTGIIYFGFPNCPWCRNAIPVLLNAAISTGVEDIYYLNVYDIRDTLALDNDGKIITEKEGSKGYKKLLLKLDSILEDYTLEDEDGNKVETNEKRIYVPLVVMVREGNIVAYHMDTVESQTDPYITLDEKQTEELYNIYVDGILKMQDSACDESC